MKKEKVLIVDDEPGMLESLSDVLKREGYKITTALDGRSAVGLVKRTGFDIVILDIVLPDVNGIEILKEIKQIAPYTEIVIISAHATVKNSVESLNQGAYAYILKPFDPDEVKAVLRRIIEKQKTSLERNQFLKDLEKSNRRLKESLKDSKEAHEELERSHRELQYTVDELQKSRDELIQTEKLSFAGRMAASVAHEIRNPLNIIAMATGQLRSELSKKDSRREYTQAIMKNAERLEGLITDFVDIAKPPRLSMKWNDINGVINDVLKLTQPRYNDRKARVIKDMGRDLPRIKIDKEHITRAFSNLLLNACDALPKRGGRIWIITKKEDGYIAIKFKNKGKPISRRDIIRVFDPFFSKKKKGTGLGLSIVYTIIGSHKGTIGVESNRKIGTAFTVRLPI